MTRLDAGQHHQDQRALEELVRGIMAEFPELSADQLPLGIVSRCYLGAPYLVHLCDLAGNILEHFEVHRPMPPVFERARRLALHTGYVFVEVYADCLRTVDSAGTVSVVEG